MSKISNLLGKPKTFIIGGIELSLKPRTLNDVDLMLDFEDPEKRGNALKELLKRTLKDAIPEATEEEINGIAMQHFNELVSAFMEVNGIAKPQ